MYNKVSFRTGSLVKYGGSTVAIKAELAGFSKKACVSVYVP